MSSCLTNRTYFPSLPPQTVRNILKEAYGNPDRVTDELVDCILKPGLQVRARRFQTFFATLPPLSSSTGKSFQLTDQILSSSQPGAAEVFLDFISYSGGPLPEELLPKIPTTVPVRILWGQADPWEVVTEGRAYGKFDAVDRFIGARCSPPFFTHRSLSTFDRFPFQLTDERTFFAWNNPRRAAGRGALPHGRGPGAREPAADGVRGGLRTTGRGREVTARRAGDGKREGGEGR